MDPEKTPDKSAGRQLLVVVGVLGAIAVNIAAFMLSADAINAVAVAAGISEHIAWAQVLAVDGLMVTGTVVFIANKLRGRSVVYPLCVLGSGVLLSIWCNALHAKAGGGHIVHLGSSAKMGVSAIPAVSLALSFHLIADMVKDSLGIAVEASDGAAVPASNERPADTAVDTSGDARADAPKDTAVDAPRTPRVDTVTDTPRTRTRTAPRTRTTPAKNTAADTRAKARELLKGNPDMNGNELAAALNRKPAGSIRAMRGELLEELRDAGELPSVRALGA